MNLLACLISIRMIINRIKLTINRMAREAADYESRAVTDKGSPEMALFEYYRHTGTQFGLQKAIDIVVGEFRRELEKDKDKDKDKN